jgi:hypothetical protein
MKAASWSCVGPKCDVRPVCDIHALVHKDRGHALTVRFAPCLSVAQRYTETMLRSVATLGRAQHAVRCVAAWLCI